MRTTQGALQKMRDDGEKIAILTCYDASFAVLLENAGVDILLVGDSLGNVLQGEESTLPVTLDDMIYHTRCVARGSSKAFIMADMPFGTSQVTPEDTFENAENSWLWVPIWSRSRVAALWRKRLNSLRSAVSRFAPTLV